MNDVARAHELIETLIGIPPSGWTIGHVTISGRAARIPIEAMRHGAFAVHEVERMAGNGWRLTHAPTGLQIWTFASVDDAIELAERIESLADWDSIKKEVPHGTDYYPKVRAVIDEIVARNSNED